jgi:hypothetical protein
MEADEQQAVCTLTPVSLLQDVQAAKVQQTLKTTRQLLCRDGFRSMIRKLVNQIASKTWA